MSGATMQQRTLSELQDLCPDMQQHLCVLQPEDLSLHSSSGDDRVSTDEKKCNKDKASSEQTNTELASQELDNVLWKSEHSPIDDDEEASYSINENISEQCKVLDHPSGGRPTLRKRETSATAMGGIANVLASTANVTCVTTFDDTGAATAPSTKASPEAIVKNVDNVIAPIATIVIMKENP